MNWTGCLKIFWSLSTLLAWRSIALFNLSVICIIWLDCYLHNITWVASTLFDLTVIYIILLDCHPFSGGELQEAREALARADSSSSDSEDESGNKKKKDQDKPTEEVWYFYIFQNNC